MLIVAFFLTSCDSEVIRTEAEYIDVATEAHAAGDSRLALFELASGIRHFPENAELQLLRGGIFLDLEDGSAAEIAYNKAVALGYNPDFIKHEIAESWMYQNNPAKVIEKLEPEILQGSRDALTYEIVGRAYIASRDRTNPTLFLKNMNMARQYINEAFQLNPGNTRVLISKAWMTAMMGNIDEALEWLKKADAIIKNQRLNLAVKGELLIRQDKNEAARDVYQTLVKKFPQYPQYKLELGYAYMLDREFGESLKWVEPIAAQYPGNLRAKYLMANISLMTKKFDVAKQLSDAILVNAPNDLKTIIVNGASSYFLGDLENAHQKLSFFYNKTSSLAGLKLLAATKLKLGDDAAASKLLEDAALDEAEQSDAEMLNLVAVASMKIGKTDVALDAYKKLVAQEPDIPSFVNNLGLIQITQGNYEEGFRNLEKALDEASGQLNPGEKYYILTNKALQTRQYDRAANYISQYKKAAGDTHKPWVMSAVLQSILKNNDGVRQDFDKAMEIAPEEADIKARYAIFEKIQGNQDKSLDLARQALEISPGNNAAAKIVLDKYVNDKNFKAVKVTIDKAVASTNISDSGKLFFADYYIMLGRPNETLKLLAPMSNRLKATASYKIIAGKAYLRDGQTRNAVQMLEDFTRINPNNIQAQKYLLHGYLLLGDERNYQATLNLISGLQPGDYDNRFDLAKFNIATGKYDKAEKILNGLAPDTAQRVFQKSIMLSTLETNRKNFGKALEILSPLYDQYPRNGTVVMLYTRNLSNDNQTDKAINVSRKWADQNPDNVDVMLFLGDLYMRKNDNEDATRQYEKILTSTAKKPATTEIHVHNNLAMIYLEENDNQKAILHAQKAFDLAPNNPAIVDTFARVLMKSGQTEKAIDHFNQALALLPNKDRMNRSVFTLGKAKALIQAGEKEKAARQLNRLLKDDPSFSQADDVKQLLSTLE